LLSTVAQDRELHPRCASDTAERGTATRNQATDWGVGDWAIQTLQIRPSKSTIFSLETGRTRKHKRLTDALYGRGWPVPGSGGALSRPIRFLILCSENLQATGWDLLGAFPGGPGMPSNMWGGHRPHRLKGRPGPPVPARVQNCTPPKNKPDCLQVPRPPPSHARVIGSIPGRSGADQ